MTSVTTALTSALTLTGLYRLALCGDAGYYLAAEDERWQSVCAELKLQRSQYDRRWLDTFARNLRQCVFPTTTLPMWIPMPRVVVNEYVIQCRQQDRNTNLVVWDASTPVPWFTVSNDQMRVFATHNGTRREQPDPAFVAHVTSIITNQETNVTPLKPAPNRTNTKLNKVRIR